MKRHPKLHGLLAEQLKALADLPDDEIDTSDIPEVTDFTDFKRGRFGRPRNRPKLTLWPEKPLKRP